MGTIPSQDVMTPKQQKALFEKLGLLVEDITGPFDATKAQLVYQIVAHLALVGMSMTGATETERTRFLGMLIEANATGQFKFGEGYE